MIKKLPFLLLLCQFSLHAQEAIFSPTSIISTTGSVSSPSAEQYYNVIDDDVETKYLDFSYFDGIGFIVNLGGVQKVATSMEFTTANDFPQRDPMNYQIWGSNNGTNYTSITTGSITCNSTRFNTTTHTFANTQAYSYYKLVFTNQCNTSEAMFQIAEVQLFENELGVNQFEQKNEFTLYPNPNNGSFSIGAKSNQSIDAVVVTDALGKQIQQFTYSNVVTPKFHLQGITSGIYFVKITSGNVSVLKKMIIK